MSLDDKIEEIKTKKYKFQANKEYLEEKDKEIEESRLKSEQRAKDLTETLNFVENTVEKIRKDEIEGLKFIVNKGLGQVYSENPPSLDFEIGVSGNRTSIKPKIVFPVTEELSVKRDPIGFGGGVSDIISLLLRIVLLRTCKGVILFCDEPFKFISADKIERSGLMLKLLCEKLDLQIISTRGHVSSIDVAHKFIHLEYEGDKVVVKE